MKEKLIRSLYKVLLLYEDVHLEQSTINEEDYLAYLNRQYVRFLGFGSEEISSILKGLQLLGKDADHATVKSTVFHMIDLVNKGAVTNGL